MEADACVNPEKELDFVDNKASSYSFSEIPNSPLEIKIGMLTFNLPLSLS